MDYAVRTGDQVTLNCEGRLTNGHVITSSKKDGPLVFKVGDFPVIRGINHAVVGMRIGENRKIVLRPKDAFGEFDPKKQVKVELKHLPSNVSVGSQFKDEDERLWVAKEVDSAEGHAILDCNHVLAGQELILDIEVINIQKN